MKDIDRVVQAILEAALELREVWHDEDQGAAWRSGDGGPPVSGGGASNPTMSLAVAGGRYRDRDRVGRLLADVKTSLTREVARQRPQPTGPCSTPRCEGEGLTSDSGRCEKCAAFWRRNGYAPDPKLVKDWNARRQRPCSCGTSCCPDGCLRMCGPGERTAAACRKAQSRARKDVS